MNTPALATRAVFLSDLHLGSPHCHAEELVEYLTRLRTRQLYLIGDVIDLWWLSQHRVRFDATHLAIFEQLRALARSGTEIVYIPGNHDRNLREFCGLQLPGITVRRDAIHRGADGRRYLVTHGDDFDAEVAHGGWRERLGDRLYGHILDGNRITHRLRRRLGLRYWSLAGFLKRQSVLAERYIERYVEAGIAAAIMRGLDGIICGHIHRPALFERRGIVYANDGDWVESLTAVSEDSAGGLTLSRWQGEMEPFAVLAPRSRQAVAASADTVGTVPELA